MALHWLSLANLGDMNYKKQQQLINHPNSPMDFVSPHNLPSMVVDLRRFTTFEPFPHMTLLPVSWCLLCPGVEVSHDIGMVQLC